MNMKTNKYAFLGLCMAAASCAATFTGCEDFFEQDSNQLVYAEGGHLNQPTDTVYSMMGILQKMQAIADRTVLLGELRGDLVDLGVNTPADLRTGTTMNRPQIKRAPTSFAHVGLVGLRQSAPYAPFG